jgi:predicted enzyme related to lactoylglutathione lyase
MKKRVTGIGGVFFKAEDPEKIKRWYEKHLGFPYSQYGSSFEWRQKDKDKPGFTAWAPFEMNTKYYDPSKKDFMFNYRVENLEELLKVLKEEGVEVVGEMETFEYGKFGWIMDPEGNKIELWEPVDEVYATMGDGKTIS